MLTTQSTKGTADLKLNETEELTFNYQALEILLTEHIDPQEMSIYLEEIETQYLSYLLRYPELPGQTAEHQIHYLRLLRKALSLVKPIK